MTQSLRRTPIRNGRFPWAGSGVMLTLAGLAQAASIAWPWGGQPLWWLQLLSLALLVWQLDALRGPTAAARPALAADGATRSLDHPRVRRSGRAGFWRGWLFSTVWLCGSFWWLFISMHTYGGLPAPFASTAVLALAAALALYYAAAAAIYVAWAPSRAVPRALFFMALWTLAELVRGSLFTGFPWGAGGYAHVDGPLAGLASWIGVYGVGAVATLLAAALAHCARLDYRRRANWLAPVAIALCLGMAALRTGYLLEWDGALATHDPRSAGRLQVALLQGNIPQNEKFVPGGGIATALVWYSEQLHSATAPLVVTPETALPMLPSQLPPGYLDAIAARFASGTQAAIVGLPLQDPGAGGEGGYSNSVIGFSPRSVDGVEAVGSATGAPRLWRYDKHHLVPFGEFVPNIFRWFTDLMRIPLGEFRRGGLVQAPFIWQGQRIAANICYEDLFGEEIGANFADEATAPTVLLNVSNIAWFGDSIAIDQHLAISRMRALEFQRPMLRATNTGATALIDHHGRVVQSLPRLTRGVLVVEVEGRTGRTLYARWVSTFGLWPLWLAGLSIVAGNLLLRRRRA